jgi:transcriptional regulator of NAD metabolism
LRVLIIKYLREKLNLYLKQAGGHVLNVLATDFRRIMTTKMYALTVATIIVIIIN